MLLKRSTMLLFHAVLSSTCAILLLSCCLLLVAEQATTVVGYQISPGTGLRSKKSNDQVVIFEHTDHGTGGLVLNCPTPLCIGELPIPRFQPFKELPLMLGCGLERGSNDKHDDHLDDQQEECNIALGEVSPWFWLHDVDDIPGSFALPGAKGALYMGGNIEEAAKRLEEHQIDPVGRFKFFRKYKVWSSGELEKELERGEWEAMEQDPKQALEPINLWA
jgi:hypothetical protein